METFVTGRRWRAVHEPLICRVDWQDDFFDQCRELGVTMAAGLDAGDFLTDTDPTRENRSKIDQSHKASRGR